VGADVVDGAENSQVSRDSESSDRSQPAAATRGRSMTLGRLATRRRRTGPRCPVGSRDSQRRRPPADRSPEPVGAASVGSAPALSVRRRTLRPSPAGPDRLQQTARPPASRRQASGLQPANTPWPDARRASPRPQPQRSRGPGERCEREPGPLMMSPHRSCMQPARAGNAKRS
jgi:hypothetical protein